MSKQVHCDRTTPNTKIVIASFYAKTNIDTKSNAYYRIALIVLATSPKDIICCLCALRIELFFLFCMHRAIFFKLTEAFANATCN